MRNDSILDLYDEVNLESIMIFTYEIEGEERKEADGVRV